MVKPQQREQRPCNEGMNGATAGLHDRRRAASRSEGSPPERDLDVGGGVYEGRVEAGDDTGDQAG